MMHDCKRAQTTATIQVKLTQLNTLHGSDTSHASRQKLTNAHM